MAPEAGVTSRGSQVAVCRQEPGQRTEPEAAPAGLCTVLEVSPVACSLLVHRSPERFMRPLQTWASVDAVSRHGLLAPWELPSVPGHGVGHGRASGRARPLPGHPAPGGWRQHRGPGTNSLAGARRGRDLLVHKEETF